jgi:glycosyltransferase involved in cell wall biosynthesis
VVDDGSTDRTAEIARSFPGVWLVSADPLPEGWSGKSNAVFTAAKLARGRWLLFTDADTVHVPGSLRRALDEANQHGATLLSYSPAQEVRTMWERAIMPVIFAELACTYRPRDVCDPQSATAAANGQYLLIRRDVYDRIGGHAAVANTLLEDVELARAVKQSGARIRFRTAGDAVSTRMYRSFSQLCEGWTKNLALLFPRAAKLALIRATEFAAIAAGVFATIALARNLPVVAVTTAVATFILWLNFLRRVRRAHFGLLADAVSYFGLPFFAFLLLRSAIYYNGGKDVSWRGRRYAARRPEPATSAAPGGQAPKIHGLSHSQS